VTIDYSELASQIDSLVALKFNGSVKDGLDPRSISDADYYEYGSQTEAIAPVKGADYSKDQGSTPDPTRIHNLAQQGEPMPEALVEVQKMLLFHSLQLLKGSCITLLKIGDIEQAQHIANTAVQTTEWFEKTYGYFAEEFTPDHVGRMLTENVQDLLDVVPELKPEALDYLMDNPGRGEIMPKVKTVLQQKLA
jgi:hypothetical protein